MSPHLLILAQAAAPWAANPMFFILAMVAVMYFLLWRPQQKQAKEHRTMLAALVKGDEIVTQGGLIGRIHAVEERILTVEVASGVRVRILRTSVQGKLQQPAPAAGAEAKKEEK